MENIEKQNKITHALLVIIIILLAVILWWVRHCCVCNAAPEITDAPVSSTTYVTNNSTTNKYYQYSNPASGVVFVYPASWGQVATSTTPCPAGTIFVGTLTGMTFTSASSGCVQIGTTTVPNPIPPVIVNQGQTTTGTGTAAGGAQGGEVTPNPVPPVEQNGGGATIVTASGDTGIVSNDPKNPGQELVTFKLEKGPYPTITFRKGNISEADFMAVMKSVDITK